MTEVAKAILDQLGGSGRLQAMVGAKDFYLIEEKGIQFKFMRSNKVNFVRIVLTGLDLYTVTFYRLGKYELIPVSTFDGIYNDMLISLFQRVTGLVLSLCER